MIPPIRTLVFQIVLGGVLGAPFIASGHGAQFVLGKVTPAQDGAVRLELTADYEQNPMIDGIGDARHALRDLVAWRVVGPGERDYQPLPEPRFEERSKLDPSIPLPTDEDTLAADHSLVTAVWEWQPPGQAVQFQVQPGTPLDVLLWSDVETGEAVAGAVRWAVLIGGDESPVIDLPRPSGIGMKSLGGLIAGAMIVGVGLAWVRKFFSKRV